jgi:signal transduction histidine kinase
MALRMYVVAREAGEEPDLNATVRTTTTLLDRAQSDIERLGWPDSTHGESLEEGLQRIVRNWSGLLTIDVDVVDRWSRPPDFVTGCIDLVSELVTNASRHGDARRVSISFRGVDGRTVTIEAVDDGSGPSQEVEEGQGLASVRRWHGEWTVNGDESRGARVTVTVRH